MRFRFPVLMWLCVLAGGVTPAGGEPSAPAVAEREEGSAGEGETVETPAITIARVAAGWRAREATLSAVDSEWRVVSRLRSQWFGPLPREELDRTPVPRSQRVHLAFSADAFRLEAEGASGIRLGDGGRSTSSFSSPGETAEQREFTAALLDRFQTQPPAQEVQPLAFVRTRERETCFWEREGDEYPRGLVYRTGMRPQAVDHETWAGAGTLLFTALLDAFSWSVRPSLQIPESEQQRWTLLPRRPVVDGRPCLAFEERPAEGKPTEGKPSGRRFWADPGRQGLVVRCVTPRRENSPEEQYDIEYDGDAERGWLPVRLTVLQMNKFGDAQDQVIIERQSVEREGEPAADRFAIEFPPATWVVDEVADEQYFVRKDGSWRPISVRETAARIRYQDLESEGEGGKRSFFADGAAAGTLEWLERSLTWPGILVTLPGACLIGLAGRAGWRRVRRRREEC